jgi:hypothetical protein
MLPFRSSVLIAAAAVLCGAPAMAEPLRNGGKLLLTGAVTNVEGGAGGGLATWSIIGGNETEAGIGGGAFYTRLDLPDFRFQAYGVKAGLFDRVELSFARQRFNTQAAGAALGLGRGFTFGQDIVSAKLRLFGDAVYGQDTVLPQVSIGVQHKIARRGAVIRAVGGRSDEGTDYLLSGSKIVLDKSVVLGGTLRLTKANQFGLLGFGGDKRGSYSLQGEASAGLLVSRKLLLGAEVRTKPDNLAFAREDDTWDVFAAYSVHRNVTVTAAYVDLGSIATLKGQRGLYLSLQAGF